MLHNFETFDSQAYGEDAIIKESRTIHKYMGTNRASYFEAHLKLHQIEDETDLVQFGQTDELDAYQLIMGELKPSGWNDDLIANPNGKRKFTSVMIGLDMKTKMTIR